jgi:antitoxin (DNA-binding transcriptional repressor) of toxin-antitoxin stability system
METISASDFKARCLAILDTVARSGRRITILKRRRPVAQLIPVGGEEGGYPQDALKGSVEVVGDIVQPVLPARVWEAERKRRRPQR